MVTLGDLHSKMKLPSNYEKVETVVTLQKKDENLQADIDIPFLNKRRAVLEVKPNIVISQKIVNNDKTLSDYAAQGVSEITSSFTQLESLDHEDFSFEDGHPGYKITYDMPLPKELKIRQIHIYRLTPSVLTTFTITISAENTSTRAILELFESVASYTEA